LFISTTYIRCHFQEFSTDRVKRSEYSPRGAPAQADVSDPYIQEIASAALVEVERRSNALYRQRIIRIVEAQQQVWFVLI
jgi:hypothetical protein